MSDTAGDRYVNDIRDLNNIPYLQDLLKSVFNQGFDEGYDKGLDDGYSASEKDRQ